MPREHRPPPPPSGNGNGNIYNANPQASNPNPTAGPYGPRNTLSSAESPAFPNLQDRAPIVDLSNILDKPHTATPKFGETSPLRNKVGETSPLRSKVGLGGNLGSMGMYYTSWLRFFKWNVLLFSLVSSFEPDS